MTKSVCHLCWLQDKDLAPLRERREWLDAVGTLRGNISDKSLVQLRTEAKAPFRLIRLILASGLLFGAGVGLIIIATRLVQSLQGAPTAGSCLCVSASCMLSWMGLDVQRLEELHHRSVGRQTPPLMFLANI